jgi:hypothetical protein
MPGTSAACNTVSVATVQNVANADNNIHIMVANQIGTGLLDALIYVSCDGSYGDRISLYVSLAEEVSNVVLLGPFEKKNFTIPAPTASVRGSCGVVVKQCIYNATE